MLNFNKKSLFVAVALVFSCLLGVTAGKADNDAPDGCPYTLKSLQGHYAIVADYSSKVAVALAQRYFDGKGNLTGTFLLNEPTAGSTTGARTLVTGTQLGTYTVNCDGSGKITRTLTSSTGLVTTQMDDFIITGAIKSPGHIFLATHIADAQETPSAIVAGGLFVTRTYTRLPDIEPQEPAGDQH